jgi:DivIVA domain-containing protein
MGQLLLILISALVVGAVVFGVSVLITGGDPGLEPAEPDGRAVPMPTSRPLVEEDVAKTRFDTALRGYRMAQVDQAMRRVAYDIGYKDELIEVLEAEIAALRSGRHADAEVLRRAREASLAGTAGAMEPVIDLDEPDDNVDDEPATQIAEEPVVDEPDDSVDEPAEAPEESADDDAFSGRR